ncbi:hypothetical protein [Streptomyces sp. NPDC002088]|uniref:hypothetical protein n=1 Tax=Streptomyces sp. NPDC002088 TaxID=3154665 RepID=UPI00332129DD
MGAFSWLRPGNDRQLAATQYAGQESASDRASRKRREAYRARVAREGDNPSRALRRRQV